MKLEDLFKSKEPDEVVSFSDAHTSYIGLKGFTDLTHFKKFLKTFYTDEVVKKLIHSELTPMGDGYILTFQGGDKFEYFSVGIRMHQGEKNG